MGAQLKHSAKRVQKFTVNNMSFTFSVKGRNLPIADKKDSDPYFKFYVNGEKIYKSKTIKNTLNPDWDEFTVSRDKFGQMMELVRTITCVLVILRLLMELACRFLLL